MPAKKATKAPATQSFESEEELIAKHTAAAPRVGEQLNDSKRGEEDWPFGIDLDTLEHNGYVVVYHRATREPSVILYDALAKQLKKVDPDTGELAFQLERPSRPPYRGVLKCFLHADDPDRPKYDQMGFVTCRKHNLPSEFQRTMHMERKHRQEWKAIQKERTDRDAAERAEFQRFLMKQIMAGNVDPALVAPIAATME